MKTKTIASEKKTHEYIVVRMYNDQGIVTDILNNVAFIIVKNLAYREKEADLRQWTGIKIQLNFVDLITSKEMNHIHTRYIGDQGFLRINVNQKTKELKSLTLESVNDKFKYDDKLVLDHNSENEGLLFNSFFLTKELYDNNIYDDNKYNVDRNFSDECEVDVKTMWVDRLNQSATSTPKDGVNSKEMSSVIIVTAHYYPSMTEELSTILKKKLRKTPLTMDKKKYQYNLMIEKLVELIDELTKITNQAIEQVPIIYLMPLLNKVKSVFFLSNQYDFKTVTNMFPESGAIREFLSTNILEELSFEQLLNLYLYDYVSSDGINDFSYSQVLAAASILDNRI